MNQAPSRAPGRSPSSPRLGAFVLVACGLIVTGCRNKEFPESVRKGRWCRFETRGSEVVEHDLIFNERGVVLDGELFDVQKVKGAPREGSTCEFTAGSCRATFTFEGLAFAPDLVFTEASDSCKGLLGKWGSQADHDSLKAVAQSKAARAAVRAAPSAAPAPKNDEPAAAPQRPEPKTPLDALASDAESSSFSIADDDVWALYPPGTSECGTDVDGHVVYLDRVKVDDEFAAERLRKQKPEVAKKYVGHFVAFTGSGDASGSGFGIGGAFKATLGKYNFAAHQYVLTLKAEDDSKWPLSGQMPNLAPETFKMDQDREIAQLGGKSLTVKGQQAMTHFLNQSSFAIPIKVPVEEAEAMKSNAPTEVLLVMRFAGLGYHKQCTTSCLEMFGTRTCGGDNEGFGQYYRADLVGYRISVKDKVVAEKQPPAGMKK